MKRLDYYAITGASILLAIFFFYMEEKLYSGMFITLIITTFKDLLWIKEEKFEQARAMLLDDNWEEIIMPNNK